mmetsp:Transcript_16679/g.35836  ORF Transcript_16679/g.35836 Transcript_16679/m.35836 type:complete len:139 (-) Transcript_16679:145-561(-)
MFDDNRKIGIGCCGIGVVCLVLGVMLFFDRTLLALGNVAFLLGLSLLMGSKVVKFFFRREKVVGTSAFFCGIAVIILLGWPFVGFIIELYGVWKLFAAFLPNLIASIQYTVPGANMVMNTWPISVAVGAIKENRRLPL